MPILCQYFILPTLLQIVYDICRKTLFSIDKPIDKKKSYNTSVHLTSFPVVIPVFICQTNQTSLNFVGTTAITGVANIVIAKRVTAIPKIFLFFNSPPFIAENFQVRSVSQVQRY